MTIESKTPRRSLSRLRFIAAAMLLVACCSFMSVAWAGYAAIVIDANTGQVVNAVNPDDQNYPASLAKMMTLYLTFQALKSGKLQPDQPLSVSNWASSRAPTKLGLRPGETITAEDCILGMVTKSANDAATVMAEGLGGSEAHFAQMMNAQAQLLGMSGSHFDNASGLPDPQNTTTARDMAKLAMALYRDFPQYSHYFSTKEFVFRGQVVHGHNNLMDRYPGMDGLKTGFTDASGFNLASTAVRDGHRLFAVVMGGRSAAARDNLMARLLDDGFEQKQTPAILVAQAAARPSVARRVLAAFSPIETAQADTVPATGPRHRRGKSLAAERKACTPRRGVTCPRVAASKTPHAKRSTTALARKSKAKTAAGGKAQVQLARAP